MNIGNYINTIKLDNKRKELTPMKLNKSLSISLLSIFLISCSNNASIDLKERLHNAYLDVIETKEENLRPLVSLIKDDEKVYWNEAKDKVLLFTLHRYPDSYPDGQEVTFSWGESWVCSVKEYENWYLNNKSNIKDPLLRTKQVLGMSDESKNTYISSMWFDPKDISRPAYITDPTKQMSLQFDENVTEEYKAWFANQYYYSYDVSKLPWTRLGYTYDWSEEAKDKYGLTEFIAWKGTTVTVEKTLTVSEFLKTFNK